MILYSYSMCYLIKKDTVQDYSSSPPIGIACLDSLHSWAETGQVGLIWLFPSLSLFLSLSLSLHHQHETLMRCSH